MFCPNCGKSVEDANYCKYCGAKLETDSVPECGEEESFEQQKAMLMKNRIPYCPECLSTHVTVLVDSSNAYGSTHAYDTRFVCLWCGHEWHPRRMREFVEPNWKRKF